MRIPQRINKATKSHSIQASINIMANLNKATSKGTSRVDMVGMSKTKDTGMARVGITSTKTNFCSWRGVSSMRSTVMIR